VLKSAVISVLFFMQFIFLDHIAIMVLNSSLRGETFLARAPMTEKRIVQAQRANFTKELGRELRQLDQSLDNGWSNVLLAMRNGLRRLRGARLDYVVMPVGGPLPERDGPPRSFIERRLPLPADPLSLQRLNARLRAVADADNVRGVVFIFREFHAGLATLQNFRAAVARLRASGKKAIVYTPYLDLPHYYAATAADRIIAPPGARFEVLGLYTEIDFLKDALARVGLQADVIQISPYKTAFDRFSRSDLNADVRHGRGSRPGPIRRAPAH
jgi:protease-4